MILYTPSVNLVNRLVKVGAVLLDQGVIRNGHRVFVLEVTERQKALARK